MITKEQKDAVIESNRTHETDTGSPEVQIAILTERIKQLTDHFEKAQFAVFVFFVDFKMLGELLDALGEDRDLNFR